MDGCRPFLTQLRVLWNSNDDNFTLSSDRYGLAGGPKLEKVLKKKRIALVDAINFYNKF